MANDGNNFLVLLQFSKKDFRGWENNKADVVERFRGVTNQMVDKVRLNVAFSLHNPDGRMVGGCARNTRQSEAVCK